MKVVDHEPHCWFLLEQEGELYLDANCSHSAVGYSFMIRLDDKEIGEYERRGAAFLGELAREIHDGVPVLESSSSAYKGRDVSRLHATAVAAAVRTWRARE